MDGIFVKNAEIDTSRYARHRAHNDFAWRVSMCGGLVRKSVRSETFDLFILYFNYIRMQIAL